MVIRKILTLSLSLTVLVLAACNKSSSGGNPGTNDSFQLKGPTLTTHLKPGERQIVQVTISRGSDFKQGLALDVAEPKGLKVTLDRKRVASADPAEVNLTVEAEKGAPLGEALVKVTATPDTGAAASLDVKVRVDEGPK